jgi:hypothetical protein
MIRRILQFYWNGFREMPSWGRKLWIIILIKFFVFFVILKVLFFPDVLKKQYKTDEERANHVLRELTTHKK